MSRDKRALILMNLGSPDGGPEGPSEEQVRVYLRQFLMDPYVIDLPFPLRWGIVHGRILRKRPAASAEAYRKIWTPRGSPLKVHLEDLVREVQQLLGSDWLVRGAMRYGAPDVAAALATVPREISELVLFPLYPQFAQATTGSSVEEVWRAFRKAKMTAPVRVVAPFFDAPSFLEPYAKKASAFLDRLPAVDGGTTVLFSFHGLPERQVRREGRDCLKGPPPEDCCETLTPANVRCYRAQCIHTARGLARRMGLPPERFHIAFQSRLGRTAWIGPHTEEVLVELGKKGCRQLAVLCPSFVSDCLETLEEIGIRGRATFKAAGGGELHLVPCLNADPEWARGVVEITRITS